MFTKLRLHNFKIWKETGDIALAPVTLLLGANSSGKSSLIQSFLLLRQTVLSSDSGVVLNFGNSAAFDSAQLGQFSDVLCKHGDDREIEIEFRWGQTADQSDTNIYVAVFKAGKGGAAKLKSLRLEKDGESCICRSKGAGICRNLIIGSIWLHLDSADPITSTSL